MSETPLKKYKTEKAPKENSNFDREGLRKGIKNLTVSFLYDSVGSSEEVSHPSKDSSTSKRAAGVSSVEDSRNRPVAPTNDSNQNDKNQNGKKKHQQPSSSSDSDQLARQQILDRFQKLERIAKRFPKTSTTSAEDAPDSESTKKTLQEKQSPPKASAISPSSKSPPLSVAPTKPTETTPQEKSTPVSHSSSPLTSQQVQSSVKILKPISSGIVNNSNFTQQKKPTEEVPPSKVPPSKTQTQSRSPSSTASSSTASSSTASSSTASSSTASSALQLPPRPKVLEKGPSLIPQPMALKPTVAEKEAPLSTASSSTSLLTAPSPAILSTSSAKISSSTIPSPSTLSKTSSTIPSPSTSSSIIPSPSTSSSTALLTDPSSTVPSSKISVPSSTVPSSIVPSSKISDPSSIVPSSKISVPSSTVPSSTVPSSIVSVPSSTVPSSIVSVPSSTVPSSKIQSISSSSTASSSTASSALQLPPRPKVLEKGPSLIPQPMALKPTVGEKEAPLSTLTIRNGILASPGQALLPSGRGEIVSPDHIQSTIQSQNLAQRPFGGFESRSGLPLPLPVPAQTPLKPIIPQPFRTVGTLNLSEVMPQENNNHQGTSNIPKKRPIKQISELELSKLKVTFPQGILGPKNVSVAVRMLAEFGWRQYEIAAASGTSSSTVSKFHRGDIPGPTSLAALENWFRDSFARSGLTSKSDDLPGLEEIPEDDLSFDATPDQEKEKQDKERQDKEKQEKEKQEKEKQDKERQQKERQEKERQEKERQEKEKQEKERQEKERQQREKQQKEKQEKERQEKERQEREKQEKERQEREKQEKERQEKEKQEREKQEKEGFQSYMIKIFEESKTKAEQEKSQLQQEKAELQKEKTHLYQLLSIANEDKEALRKEKESVKEEKKDLQKQLKKLQKANQRLQQVCEEIPQPSNDTQSFTLILIFGGNTRREFPMKFPSAMGTSDECFYHFKRAQGVDKKHASFRWAEGQIYIRNCSSSFGLWNDFCKVEPGEEQVYKLGSVFSMGNQVLTIRPSSNKN